MRTITPEAARQARDAHQAAAAEAFAAYQAVARLFAAAVSSGWLLADAERIFGLSANTLLPVDPGQHGETEEVSFAAGVNVMIHWTSAAAAMMAAHRDRLELLVLMSNSSDWSVTSATAALGITDFVEATDYVRTAASRKAAVSPTQVKTEQTPRVARRPS